MNEIAPDLAPVGNSDLSDVPFLPPATFVLPNPPSANKLYKTVQLKGKRRKALTKEHKAWRNDAGWDIQIQRPGCFKGPVKILIESGGRKDPDNCAKAVLDLMKIHGVIENDSPKFIKELIIRPNPELDGCRVSIVGVET